MILQNTGAALASTCPTAKPISNPGYSIDSVTGSYLYTAPNLVTYLYNTIKKSWVQYSADEVAALKNANSSNANNNNNNNNTTSTTQSVTSRSSTPASDNNSLNRVNSTTSINRTGSSNSVSATNNNNKP